jgi:hypothetical protein
LNQVISSDGFGSMDESVCHFGSFGDGFFIKVERGEVVLLVLEVGFEHDNGELSSEVGLPSVGIFHGDEIDFVEDDDDFFVWHRLDFPLNVFAPTGQGVSGIEDFKQDVAIFNDLFHHVVVFVCFKIRIVFDFLHTINFNFAIILWVVFLLFEEVVQL